MQQTIHMEAQVCRMKNWTNPLLRTMEYNNIAYLSSVSHARAETVSLFCCLNKTAKIIVVSFSDNNKRTRNKRRLDKEHVGSASTQLLMAYPETSLFQMVMVINTIWSGFHNITEPVLLWKSRWNSNFSLQWMSVLAEPEFSNTIQLVCEAWLGNWWNCAQTFLDFKTIFRSLTNHSVGCIVNFKQIRTVQ